MLQLYNEEIVDLFGEQGRKLRIHEDQYSNIYVAGATEQRVSSEQEVLSVCTLQQGCSGGVTNFQYKRLKVFCDHEMYVYGNHQMFGSVWHCVTSGYYCRPWLVSNKVLSVVVWAAQT